MVLGYICSSLEVEILSETTMRKIFDESTFFIITADQLMVIYVCEEKDPETYEHFSDYCWEHPCAFLEVKFSQAKEKQLDL